MVKRKFIFFTTLSLLTVVFIIGMLLGWSLSTTRLGEATKFIKENELNTESFIIEQELFEIQEQNNCELAKVRLSKLSDQLWNLGKTLDSKTAKKDLGKDNYNFLKRKFHLLQIRVYTFYYKLKQGCGLTNPIILFYFKQGNEPSEEQGKILDQIVKAYDARVFAIEHNYSQELTFLEDYHGITLVPSLVINYEVKKQGLVSFKEIELAIQKNK